VKAKLFDEMEKHELVEEFNKLGIRGNMRFKEETLKEKLRTAIVKK